MGTMSELKENESGVNDVLFWCHVVSLCSVPTSGELSPAEKDALHRAIMALHTTTTLYTNNVTEAVVSEEV
ncbi:hypothetical protein [Vibrio gazogenes]|jgi:hypothetical protein|uniref:Uncharacterized protein n=1 Tax=Vibrio gazogenes DSM 21264 = NBRC 103151 TaxID=1123492 RepID=A0A1M5BPV5_VIBGA|nr:hypothetical protein [Vibrio gazogenes]USP13708.1 hypothetical protein MKS89_15270 [Vibrio gazogenes]SHF44445.1 hypothetical protein SAMN02745781_02286 [Vibrio gazogenes DSM 21264] [Vibrio gazogenes DSM 21264 = NBRC 103151]SJN54388.1 hypothetical protein BQ6471_00984 [Vibrio gazogenes]